MSWHCIQLGNAIHVKHGFAFKGQYFSDTGTHVVLTPGNFNEEGGFRLRPGKDRFYSGDIPEDYVLCEGDLIVAMTEQGPGLLGSSAWIPEGDKYLHNQRLGLVQIFDDALLDKRFLYYLFNTRMVRGQIRGSATGTKVKHTAPERIYRVTASIPADVTEQRRIGEVLSAYDDLIDNNRRRIKLLEQAARLLYREWFVHLRYPGYEHVTITDGVPDGWEICGMMEHPYFEFIRENIGSFDDYRRYYATADISGIFITGEGIEYSFEEKPSRAQKAPEVGSVWFARMQETYKVLVFTETNREVAEGSILSSGFAGFRARRPDFLPFLYLVVNNERFHEEKDRFCTGATQRSLTNGGLKNIQTIVPTAGIVSTFADLAGPMIDQILSLQAANKQLKLARNLLLPRLMSGEVAV